MSIRQYIGARYMPKFMGTYDPTTAYEALSVVDNGMGTTYVSNKPTPPNTPLTDTDYWAFYGASSGAVVSLQDQIDDMKDGNVSGSLQNQINTIGTELGSNTDGIINGSVTDTLAVMNKRRLILIADSYGTGSGGATPYSVPLKNYLGIDNADYYPYAEGSLGFNQAGLLGHTAQTLLELHENDVTSPESITDVVFVMGGNDIENQTGLETAIDSCFNYVKTTYPNARIIVAFSYNQFTKVPSYVRKYIDCIEAYYKYVTMRGALWVDNFMYIMHNYDYVLNDGVHPNTDGGRALARSLAAFLNGRNSDVKYHKQCTYSTAGGNTATIDMMIDNGIATIMGNFRVDATAITAGNNDIKIGTIATPLFLGTGLGNHSMGYLRTTTHGQVLPVRLYLFEGDIYMQLYSFSSDNIANNEVIYTGTFTAATLEI